ncbi:MAG: hypothetical protein JO040_02045 [Gemmatimonadetes bacterium]|nr:hypothetical protein [Gemmatimonadota bacterium]
MRFSLGSLTQNWMLKLAALALAVLLWVVVSAEEVTTQWITVPIRLAARDSAYTVVAGPSPREVEVRFSGPGRELWELALTRPVLLLSIGEVERESQSYALGPGMVRVPAGVSAVTVLDVRPASAWVRFRRTEGGR